MTRYSVDSTFKHIEISGLSECSAVLPTCLLVRCHLRVDPLNSVDRVRWSPISLTQLPHATLTPYGTRSPSRNSSLSQKAPRSAITIRAFSSPKSRRNTTEHHAKESKEMSPSPAQFAANRTNAIHSPGPITDAGKAKVSLNAVKTGLTGVLPFDDAAAYQKLILDYQNEFQPSGPLETALVQSITDVIWRLDRIPALLIALIEMGSAELPAHIPPGAALEVRAGLHFEKQIHNIQLQENRLARRREKEIKELLTLQKSRKEAQAKANEEAGKTAKADTATAVPETSQSAQTGLPTPESSTGFEFSATSAAPTPDPSTSPKPVSPSRTPSQIDRCRRLKRVTSTHFESQNRLPIRKWHRYALLTAGP